MGNSQPPPVDFDLIDSYARRRGDDIEIVLARPADSLASGSVAVRFSKAGATVHGSGFSADEGTIPRLILRAPRHEFTNGIWSMRLQPDHRSEETIGARLLVQGQRPLVLLWG